MAEAFKHLINAATVAHAAHHLRRAWRGFDAILDRHGAMGRQGGQVGPGQIGPGDHRPGRFCGPHHGRYGRGQGVVRAPYILQA